MSGFIIPSLPADFLEKEMLDCHKRLNDTSSSNFSGKFCPGTFDGWLCWNNTAAGTIAYESCPYFVIGFDPSRYAHKSCDENGEWFQHPDSNITWSNYTTCVNVEDFEWKHGINIVNELGYGISLIALLVSLFILVYFKSLRCARITLHINLFASFAANNLLWLIWYLFILSDIELLEQSPNGCVILHIAIQYFLLTNYSWMLCEGFYLHTVLVSAFISERLLIYWLVSFGWAAPGLIIFIYGMTRWLDGDSENHQHCWMHTSSYDTIFIVPVCISIFFNLLFLCNIIRVVLLKLNAPASLQDNSSPSRPALQAFRATLLLVPLLGLHYILTPFRPEHGHPWEHAYDILSTVTTSFQGLCVATLFCFLNGEVMTQIKRKWRTTFFNARTRTNSYTATQVSYQTLLYYFEFKKQLPG